MTNGALTRLDWKSTVICYTAPSASVVTLPCSARDTMPTTETISYDNRTLLRCKQHCFFSLALAVLMCLALRKCSPKQHIMLGNWKPVGRHNKL